MKRRDFVKFTAAAPLAATPVAKAAAAFSAPIKVFKLNDYEWWAAASLAEAIADWKQWTGFGDEEAAENLDDPRELSDEEMDRLQFAHTEEDDTPYRKQSFRAELAEQIAAGETFPGFFATTEY
jgi:hypothetical protein